MIAASVDFADIYDLVGIRVLVDSVRDCYASLGTIHARWKPVPGRFKDYIAMPKFNMYQSLHTTVIGPGGKPVELQIRTYDMHKRAEYGIAAHWKYKEDMVAHEVTARRRDHGRQDSRQGDKARRDGVAAPAARLAARDQDPGEFLDRLRFDLPGSEVYVFTPGRRGHACRRAPHRSTSPMRSTPRSATAASGLGSTAVWCRWKPRSTTATRLRSSLRRHRPPARAATG